jgi:hypothetical protein
MQTLDYLDHCSTLSHRDVVLDADGRFELLVAHRNPGHRNWVDTTGHRRGFVYFRWLLPDAIPDPLETRVVELG